jgi:hypothetical protein
MLLSVPGDGNTTESDTRSALQGAIGEGGGGEQEQGGKVIRLAGRVCSSLLELENLLPPRFESIPPPPTPCKRPGSAPVETRRGDLRRASINRVRVLREGRGSIRYLYMGKGG